MLGGCALLARATANCAPLGRGAVWPRIAVFRSSAGTRTPARRFANKGASSGHLNASATGQKAMLPLIADDELHIWWLFPSQVGW